MRLHRRVAFLIAGVMTLGTVLAVLWRIQRCVDFTDEAFYISLAHRFALGDRPFVHELNIAQTAALLLYPFVKLHVVVRGTTGIVLFTRVLYVLFFGFVGWTTYRLGATRLPKYTALLVGAVAVVFIPYGIPGLSYNTLGSGLLTIGLFVIARALVSPPELLPKFRSDPLVWGGFALAAATFAYPSLIVSAVVATMSVCALATGQRVASTARVAMGGGMFALVVSPVFALAGPSHLREMFAYSAGNVAMTTDHLKVTGNQFFALHPQWSLMLVVVACMMTLARKWPRLVIVGLPLLPWLAEGSPGAALSRSLAYLSVLALMAPLLALALRDTRFAITVTVGAWLPSAIGGAMSASTSTNGAIAAGLGLLPAALVSAILLAVWIEELTRRVATPILRTAFGFAPAVILHTMLKLTLADDAVYRDSPLPQLTATVSEGPYKGLRTTVDRERLLARMSSDLRRLATTSRTLFYYDFPAGYLITSRRPLAPSTWIFPIGHRTTMDAERFSESAAPGDVVFRFGPMSPSMNALDRAVNARCDSTERRDGYAVWRVR